jgi:hypothetical protein
VLKEAYALEGSSSALESCLMAKRKISAKEAVEAIRSGMDDSTLMKEYGLAPSGLQSLLDKLVTGGYLDLGEIQDRMPGFMGAVNIGDPVFAGTKDGTADATEDHGGRAGAWINAQEAARDIRAGLDDAALMEKYRLTSRGLRSMVDKLVGVKLITQADLDLRRLGIQENTVALREEMVGLTDMYKYLGQPAPRKTAQLASPKPEQTIIENTREVTPPDNGAHRPQQVKQSPPVVESHWHDNPLVLIITLICVFPLGFYALYLNSRLSGRDKRLIIFIWISLVFVSLTLASEWLQWPW